MNAQDRTGQVWSFHLTGRHEPNVVWLVVSSPKKARGAFVHMSLILFDAMVPTSAGSLVEHFEHHRSNHEQFSWEDSPGVKRIL